MYGWKNKNGFTIVELLIVVVVIAILAAITIVSFNGIQNRANDTSVQSDLRINGSAIQQYFVTQSSYPVNSTQLRDTVKLKVNKSAVSTSMPNTAIYCRADDKFSLVMLSKSGKGYYYSSVIGGVAEYPSSWSNGSAQLCPDSGVLTTDTGYQGVWLRVNDAWSTWL